MSTPQNLFEQRVTWLQYINVENSNDRDAAKFHNQRKDMVEFSISIQNR